MQNICELVCCYDTNGNGILEESEFKMLMDQVEKRFLKEAAQVSSAELTELVRAMKYYSLKYPPPGGEYSLVPKWNTKFIVQVLFSIITDGCAAPETQTISTALAAERVAIQRKGSGQGTRESRNRLGSKKATRGGN